MQAHKVKVTIPEDHQLEIRLPEDFPSGPAEVIVLASRPEATESQKSMMTALTELRELQRTPEEEQVLEDFEEFRRAHPFTLSSPATTRKEGEGAPSIGEALKATLRARLVAL